MRKLFQKVFTPNMQKRGSSFRPRIEALEDRLVPTAIYLTDDSAMHVVGSSQADQIVIDEAEVFAGYQVSCTSWGCFFYPVYETHIQATIKDSAGNVVDQDSFKETDVSKISVLGQSGDDLINNHTYKPSEISGQNGDDTIYGGFAADTLRGGDGDDVVYGRNGNDEIHFDHIYGDDDYANGGSGNDTYAVDARPYSSPAGQKMRISDSYGVNSLDFSAYQSGIDIDLWDSSMQEVAWNLYLDTNSSAAIRNVVGTEHSDRITGSAYGNILEGRGGNDWIEGMQGNDTLRGGDGSDTYRFRTDPKLGSQYSSTMNLGTDRIEDNAMQGAYGTNDKLDFRFFTRSGVNIDINSTATQSVGTGLAIDLSSNHAIRNVDGTAMADTILGNSLNNRLFGDGGSDTIRGRNGDDVLDGGSGNDTLSGGNGKDLILGGYGNDKLYSDETWGDNDGQNDTLSGGPGSDSGSDDGWWWWD